MSLNRSLAIICLASAALLALGCGGSEGKEENRWVNEMLLVNGEFKETSVKGKERIAQATTPAQLEAAYTSYAKAMRKQIARVEELEPPDECRDEQEAMERFMKKVAAVTEELSDQGNLTRARLKEIEGEILIASRALYFRFQTVAKAEHC